MNTTKRQSVRRQGGSAFILVVVVTVLLAVIGLMFVMVARLGEMGSSAVVDNADLDAAVQTVVSRINTALVADLFGADGVIGSDGPHYTWPGVARGDDPLTGDRIVPWLADLEPNAVDNFRWEHITNLSNPPMPVMWDRLPVIVPEYQPAGQIVPGHYADPAGDGVADSIWIRLPNASTSRGKPVFAAIRIIDNCAMLNFNTAFGFYQSTATGSLPWHSKLWLDILGNTYGVETAGDAGSNFGGILGEVNATPFLRAYDRNRVERLHRARDPITFLKPALAAPTPQDFFDKVILNIESPENIFTLFGIDDELEIRNRFLLTSKTIGRFEKRHLDTEARTAIPPANPYSGTLYYTFDFGRGTFDFDSAGYGKSRVPSTPFTMSDFAQWKDKINPLYFDFNPDVPTLDDYVYDRRHISTFYSFDRPLRTGQYPKLEMNPVIHSLTPAQLAVFVPDKAMPIDLRTADIMDAKTKVQLLYALREVYDAQTAAQIVVNLMDYVDSDNEVSILNTERISAYIFAAGGGVSGMAMANDFGLGDAVVYGYERQPFISEIYTQISSFGVVERFAIELLNPYDADIDISGWEIVFTSTAGVETAYSVPSGAVLSANRGRRVLCSEITISGTPRSLMTELKSLTNQTQSVELRRPTVAEPLAVDRISREIILQMIDNPSTANSVHNSAKRDDRGWRVASNLFASPTQTATYSGTLGTSNDEEIADASNYQLPVANDDQPIERLADFIRVAFVSNTGGDDPNTITELIADAGDEADIRYDMEAAPELLDYICFLNRPDQGSLPGRININTAALHVIAAAIPPQLVMAAADDAEHALYLAGQIVANRPYERVSDLLRINAFKKFAQTGTPNVGDQGVEGDFEERDWIVSRLANIFTVRSDTFTAYILVRLGDDGPQRRMIAIFDRSQVWTPSDRPRLVALHPVPEAR